MLQQRTADLCPGCIAIGMQNAIPAMSTLTREHQLAIMAIETCAPLQKLVHAQRSFFDQHFCCFAVYQAISRIDRVFKMKKHVLIAAHCNGNATLRVTCV